MLIIAVPVIYLERVNIRIGSETRDQWVASTCIALLLKTVIFIFSNTPCSIMALVINLRKYYLIFPPWFEHIIINPWELLEWCPIS